MRVHPHEATLPADDTPDNPWRGGFAQLYLAAVQAGIAARALDDAVWFVRERARPIKHSSAQRSTDDPYVRQTVGEIAARAQTARAVVLLAAETLDDARTEALEDDVGAGAERATLLGLGLQVEEHGLLAGVHRLVPGRRKLGHRVSARR